MVEIAIVLTSVFKARIISTIINSSGFINNFVLFSLMFLKYFCVLYFSLLRITKALRYFNIQKPIYVDNEI